MRCQPKIIPNSKIMLVGEAPGKEEEIAGVPFVGSSGRELNSMLKTAGISRDECSITNVFLDRPPNNQVEHFFVAKKFGCAHIPPLRPGKYLKPEFKQELARLRSEILQASPNVVVALGATACWALTGNGKIGTRRGFVVESSLAPCQKVLPTYHPAAILRQWELRPTTIIDLMKATREAESPLINRPERVIWIEPTLSDIEVFFNEHLLSAKIISLDVETGQKQIKCISFSPTPYLSLVIPFLDERKANFSYWENEKDELAAWEWVRKICLLPCSKVGHNGLYDIQYLWRAHGIPVKNYSHDTMLLHHTLQPELPKSLGFLGSIYTNEAAWKEMRESDETEKLNE